MSLHVVEKLIEMTVGALLLASALIRARRSYPAIRDLPRHQRNTWAFPLIFQGSIGGVLLLGNLNDLMVMLGVPWLLVNLLLLVGGVCVYAPALALIWMAWRSKLERARDTTRTPGGGPPK